MANLRIALAGNPNCGKTTLFNELTGSNQYVGNWPGVTVEKKEGKLVSDHDIVIQDLPGIYSLSPYTPEEVVSRTYLVNDEPDVILNVVDASHIERNLYLTTQLSELGVPLVLALNMMDIVERSGDTIDTQMLGRLLNCRVVEASALKGIGGENAAQASIEAAEKHEAREPLHVFSGAVEHALAHIEESVDSYIEDKPHLRWFVIKLFERDEMIYEEINIPSDVLAHIEEHIKECEKELDDDSVSIIINERYDFIEKLVKKCVVKKSADNEVLSDKIDNFVTNRYLALPIFASVMFFVYFISVTVVGNLFSGFITDKLFGEWIGGGLSRWFSSIGVADWVSSLTVDGVIAGVGSVLGFVPQMMALFFMLSVLEDVGYMSRIAFIMDKVFHKFGLSGKSFIPMLVGSGCSVPGIMASRTIESENDRRMTIMTTAFIPCGAKMPMIALIAGALFKGAWWVAPVAYFIGVASVIISGVMLKKTKLFIGKDSPFIMELVAYHAPSMKNVLKTTWDRSSSFIKRAGSVILLCSIVIWFLSSFGFVGGKLTLVSDMNASVLSSIGGFIAPLFVPLGFGYWQSAVASLMGLLAKEEIVGALGVLYAEGSIALHFTQLSAFSFMLFNLLCAPCFASMSAIAQEMKSAAWTVFAISYMCVFAYCVALMTYQFGMFFTTGAFTFPVAAAFAVLLAMVYMLLRRAQESRKDAENVK